MYLKLLKLKSIIKQVLCRGGEAVALSEEFLYIAMPVSNDGCIAFGCTVPIKRSHLGVPI